MKRYEWVKGSRFQCEPEEAFQVIASIRERKQGVVIAEDIVEHAHLDPHSPIRPDIIDRPVPEAAEEHYRNNARYMLRSIQVVDSRRPGIGPVRAFATVNIVSRGPGGPGDERDQRVYTTIEDALADDELRQQVIERALREARAFARKYEQLVELSALVKAMRVVEESLTT